MYSSETFGRLFWVDDDYEFKSCPQNIDGTGDFDQWDYVSEWTDWEGVDYNLLLAIHRCELINKVQYACSLKHNQTTKVSNKEEVMNTYDEQFYRKQLKIVSSVMVSLMRIITPYIYNNTKQIYPIN